MNLNQIHNFIEENRWIITASIFFIVWKFFLIGVMWEDRAIPPEPDDSYEYVAQIAAISECHSKISCSYPGVSMTDHSGFTYLSYRLFFGFVGKLFHLTPETTFHLGFYIGTVLLVLVLVPFLSSFTTNKKLIAWSVFFLSFYHGTGESHGFFWVVPSFFSVFLFFVLFAYITRDNFLSKWVIAPIAITFTFVHPMSEYLIFILPIYVVVLFFFTKKADPLIVIKTVFLIVIVLISSFVQSQYFDRISQINYYGINESFKSAKERTINLFIDKDTINTQSGYSITQLENTTYLQQRLDTMNVAYFRFIIPHWTALILLIAVLFILFKKESYKLLSLYLTTLIFFVGATMLHQFGFRAAILLWPVTYILYAFAVWYVMEFLIDHRNSFVRIPGIIFVAGTIVLFLIINAILSIVFNSNLNARNNYVFDQSFADHLSKIMQPDDRVALNGILVRTTEGAQLYLNGKVASAASYPKFLTIINPDPSKEMPTRASLTKRISSIIAQIIGIPATPAIPSHIEKNTPEGYIFNSRFGEIDIYERL